MKKTFFALAIIILQLSACILPGQSSPVETLPVPGGQTLSPGSACGDGLCNKPESPQNCPQDCGGFPALPVTSALPASAPPAGFQPAGADNTFWVTNPTSSAKLYVQVFYPNDWNGTDSLPALVLMPGGIAESDPQKAARLSGQGLLVIIFDADGRGKSEGTEDYNGYITQDGLAVVINVVTSLPGLDAKRYGLVSFSYGVTAATGTLARYPDLPIKFYIDWEGPVDRNYTTTGCGQNRAEGIQWQPCTDNAWWSEREAVNFIGSVRVPYQRVQSQTDHVQPNNNHAIDIVNAAVAGDVPWVRLNEYPPDQTYDVNNPPAMLDDALDKQVDVIIARYAEYINAEVLPGLK
jgi:pimeloyl-ACP methyl ester carboxylesterase